MIEILSPNERLKIMYLEQKKCHYLNLGLNSVNNKWLLIIKIAYVFGFSLSK